MANEFLDKNGVQTLWNKTKQLVKNYVPYTGAINDIDLGVNTLLTSGTTPDETTIVDGIGLYIGSNSGDTHYGNHQISYTTKSMTKTLYFPGAEGTANNSDVIAVRSDLSEKQDKLISGTNIKTINNKSILGSGNITINDSRISQLTDEVSTDTTGYQFSSYFIINNMKLEWGHVNSGTGNANVTVSVNFPSSFKGIPIVLLQTYNRKGSPTNESESTTSQSQYRNAQSVRKVSSTGFMFDTGNSESHGYSWIAIGRK